MNFIGSNRQIINANVTIVFVFKKRRTKKKSGNGKRVMFSFLFPLFQQYWLFCREYQNHTLHLGQFLLLQSRVFEKIHLEWRTFKWKEKELDWICSRIHSKDPVVDPSKFNLNPIVYIDHLKTYYFSETIFSADIQYVKGSQVLLKHPRQ